MSEQSKNPEPTFKRTKPLTPLGKIGFIAHSFPPAPHAIPMANVETKGFRREDVTFNPVSEKMGKASGLKENPEL